MADRKQSQKFFFAVSLGAALVTTLFLGAANAQTVTFTYKLTCNVGSPSCPHSNLGLADQVGQVSGDSVTIATVNSDVPGYTQPVPINGGLLNWMSAPATSVRCYSSLPAEGGGPKGLRPSRVPGLSHCNAGYANPGGSASIVGSVFGLPNGSSLLAASFFGGATSQADNNLGEFIGSFKGSIDISYINPVILANLGMAGLPNHGSGVLYDEIYQDYQAMTNTFTVSVTFTPGSVNVIHSFSDGSDGAGPYGGLTMDKAGNVYGTASAGGDADYGTVFRLTNKGAGWVFTPLYSFQGGNDGANPRARVIVGPDGGLYGTTTEGGGSGCYQGVGCGTVFSLRPLPRACTTALCPWTETVLYRFTGGNDGASPTSEVIFDHAGNLYGTTYAGGRNGAGTVFQLTPSGSGWTESVLYSFSGFGGGLNPAAGLIFDSAGNLYGTTTGGGQGGNGTVYQLTPSGLGWTEKTIYLFQGGTDGSNPQASLVLDRSGNLYGTSSATVYELSPSNGGWAFSVIYNLTSGIFFNSALSMDASGNLYGANGGGGDYGYGLIFKLAPSNGTWAPTVLYQFTGGGDGTYPTGAVPDAKGNLFGTTYGGGANGNYGVVFEVPAP